MTSIALLLSLFTAPPAFRLTVDEWPSSTPAAQSGESACATESPDNCQLPDQQPQNGVLSVNNNPQAYAENITVLDDGVIDTVCWWGLYYDMPRNVDCGPGVGADDFQITIYLDSGGEPGALHAGPFSIGAVTPVLTGQMIGPFNEYSFSASLDTDVSVVGGNCYWVEISNLGNIDDTCKSFWNTAPPGDQGSAAASADSTQFFFNNFDLTLCVHHSDGPDPGIDDQGCDEGNSASCSRIAHCADKDHDEIRDDNCVWWACEEGECVSTDIVFGDMKGPFEDCAPDGVADGHDRFGALNCFANMDLDDGPFQCEDQTPTAPPTAFNVDAGGPFGSCEPDGVCDGNDVFHALNAFGNMSSCTCPLGGPGPTAPQRRTGTRD